MKKIILNVSFVAFLFVLFGCASTYKPIIPSSVYYTNAETKDSLTFAYKYDVLKSTDNHKYAKHEDESGIKLVSVSITNNTGKTINMAENIAFYAGSRQLIPLDPMFVKNQLKQGVAVYLLYLLLTPMTLNSSNGSSSSSVPIGIVVGPGIAIGNMAVAASANADFFAELDANYIFKNIEKGQTKYALLAFRDIGFEALKIKLK
ncbi:MAG: hypothetical protein RL711_1531 [Bacteroidota bacterium]|jgi:hypothetical protein